MLLTSWSIEGRRLGSSPQYQIRSSVEKREMQEIYNPLSMRLSFSDDGATREDEFYLDLFDTPDVLTDSGSPQVISDAMNFFLLSELKGLFNETLNEVHQVKSEIVHLKTRNGKYLNETKFEVDRVGTEARMKVFVTFQQTPSPPTEDVEIVLRYIMSNMTNFVTNLTNSVSENNELSEVYEAIRREIRPQIFVQPPDQNIIVEVAEGEQNTGPSGGSSDSKLIIPTVVPIVGVALLAAVVVFFVFKKREKPTEPSVSIKDAEMMYDVENEVFSLDRSVGSAETETPMSKPSISPVPEGVEESPLGISVSDDYTDTAGCDSVFSGISVLSPKSLNSPKSMMTGFTCASGSTVRASNVNKSGGKVKLGSKSFGDVNTVFDFLDPIEDADEEDDEDIDLKERAQPNTKSSGESASETESSSSSSSLEGVTINHPNKKDQTFERTEATTVNPVSDMLLADLEHSLMETSINSPRDPTPSNMGIRVHMKSGLDPTPKNGEAVEKIQDENPSSVTNMASKLMGGFFKGRQKSASTPNSPTSSPPASPMNQVGRHWLTSSDKKPKRKIPLSPKIDAAVDYDAMMSNPSPTEDNYNHSRAFDDSIDSSLPIIDRAPQDLPAEYTPGGRRHVGDQIGVDGSALYQASAMKPTDWSVKSSDAESVESSTIDDASQNDSKNETPTQSKKSMSASRQLISDLVWLEKKIAKVRGGTKLTRSTAGIEADDSAVDSSNDEYSTSDTSNMVSRECLAPAGKLNIIIHSTKDGPAVYTVKEGSVLAGDIYPGDLITSIDDVDTRSCSAEEVMNMMASKGDKERKITVLRSIEEATC